MPERIVDGDQPSVRAFEWRDWRSLWQLRFAELAEHGVHLDPSEIPDAPQDTPPGSYEWDIDHIEEVYLSGAGGFWLAWLDDAAVGMVGAQDLGAVVELRRMYVRAECRRRGLGHQLVQALIDHCTAEEIVAIELWTSAHGPGRGLYQRLGFRRVDLPEPDYRDLGAATGRSPNNDEIRMRFELSSIARVIHGPIRSRESKPEENREL